MDKIEDCGSLDPSSILGGCTLFSFCPESEVIASNSMTPELDHHLEQMLQTYREEERQLFEGVKIQSKKGWDIGKSSSARELDRKTAAAFLEILTENNISIMVFRIWMICLSTESMNTLQVLNLNGLRWIVGASEYSNEVTAEIRRLISFRRSRIKT
jgi:hypothetical protein